MFYGIDIGGTKTEIVAFDDEMQIRWRKRVATPVQDYELFLSTFSSLIDTADWATGEEGKIGIGMPGLMDRQTGELLSSNVPCLTGRRIVDDLIDRVSRPIAVDNDCCCFALSEAHTQQARQYPRIFGAIIGTGLGGGLVIDGQLYRGRNRMACEFGHLPLAAQFSRRYQLPELACGCGLSGCVERYLSGPGLLGLHRHFSGKTVTMDALWEGYQQQEPQAMATITAWVDMLGGTLAQLQLILDVDAFVLGGGVSNVEAIYALLPQAMKRYLFPGLEPAKILPAVHGASSGVRGAALLQAEQYALQS
ncbi:MULTISPECIES: ROK family protein [Enterobacterales]|uniref:ROK family protein n=1 Tax=Enterobacterales TaxID=91347 RepID=UPI002EDAF261